ncbi:K02A2.6-like, partial [Cordylochernes scorpioides]
MEQVNLSSSAHIAQVDHGFFKKSSRDFPGKSECSGLLIFDSPMRIMSSAYIKRWTVPKLGRNLTERYLQDPDLTLSKAIALGRAAESSRTQLKEIKEEVTVDKLSSYKETSSNKNTEHKFVKKNHKLFKACGKCASKHEYGNCPAYSKQCHRCKKPNHYAKCSKNKIVHDIAENDIYSITSLIRHTPIRHSAIIRPCSDVPTSGLSNNKPFGLIEKVNSLHQCINNISSEVILNKYKDVFEGVGLLKNKQSILIKEDAIPQVYTARRLPLAMREPVREELEKMSKLGVIKKINKPTEWSYPMVVVKKPNGDVWICIDPRKLNYWIKRERYMMPSPEEVLALIQKANIYTVLDAFWQIPLTDEASLLTTMSTPYGRYCYTRMPYGLSSAPEIFQRIIHQLYLGVPNVVTYMDDVLIYSDSETEHLKILGQVLEIARENGLKFDKTKMQQMQPSVRYLGHIVSTEGIRPLESKVKAILDMPRPQDKKALQRFLGMVTYLAKFLPNLSDKTANMRLLLRKNEPWVWNDLRDRDYRNLKLQLMSAPCLRHFDPKLDMEISTDASSNRLGAVLQQQGVPITYSSTALSAAQNKYSQIEKELLAVYFGCKRNHLYLYGRKFTAFTDHKPLLTIMKKPMVDLSPRLQRLVLQLQHYDFDLKYIPGKNLYTADALSRDYIANDLFTTPEIEISQNNQVLMVTYSNNHHQDLVEATNNDPVLQEVKNYIENGWPIHKKTMNPLVKPFWDIKEVFGWEEAVQADRRFYEGHGDRTEKGRLVHTSNLGGSTVHRLWRRWLEQGNVAINRNVGATRVTSARVDRRILRQAVAAPQATCTAILQHVQDTLDHSISTRTISRRLVANGLHSCRPLRRLPLTPPNRRQRLEWCRARSTWMTEWHRVVFSDESRFCLSSDSRRVRVCRRRGERSNPAAIVERPTMRPRGIMVWGAIAYDSRSPLLRIQGTMTAQRYIDDVLRPVTLPYLQGVPNALYQQDNARPHTARISQQALQDVQMLPWPPYSPDLSPIEHVWDIIGRRLHALPQP